MLGTLGEIVTKKWFRIKGMKRGGLNENKV